jgi:6-phosphogluconolactonase (cycloisomerase 2 family)
MRRNSTPLAIVGVSLVCILVLGACSSAPVLRYITISPASATIDAGTQEQYSATAYYSDGSFKDGTSLVTWASSNNAVATIVNGGLATGVGPGTTTISAAAAGTPGATATLNVLALVSIAITANSSTVAAGATDQFTATGTFNNGSGTVMQDITNQVAWNSSNTAAATIDPASGLATGVAPGKTQITASLFGITSNSYTLTVGGAVPASLVITPGTQTIAVGNAFTFTVQEMDSLGNTNPPSGAITWSSSDATTAEIVATPATTTNAIAVGLAANANAVTITATEPSLSISGTASLTVVTGTAHFAYVANDLGDTTFPGGSISTFTVTASPTSTTPFTPTVPPSIFMGDPVGLLIHPSNAWMYEQEAGSNIYIINVASDGTLHPAAIGPAVGGSGNANYMASDPYGRLLYATDDVGGTLFGFTVSPTDGTLTTISGAALFTTLGTPTWVGVDPTGQYVYVVNQTSNSVSAYSITQTPGPTFGTLTPLSSGGTANTGSTPQFAAMDPSGTHLYVANSGDNTITMIPLGPNGALGTPVTSSAISPATSIDNVIVDPSGTHIYALDLGTTAGQVFGFALNSDGTINMTPIPGTPIATGDYPAYNMVVDPTGVLLALTNNFDGPPGTVSLFNIGASPVTADTPAVVGSAPAFVVLLNAP